MRPIRPITALIAVIAAIIAVLAAPSLVSIKAASVADMNNITPQAPTQTGRDHVRANNDTNTNTNDNGNGQKFILMAVADSQVTPGRDAGVTVMAHMANGTAIEGVKAKVQYIQYTNSSHKVELNGTTDRTGDFKVSTPISDTEKIGQWAVLVAADKPGFKHTEVSTGFAVTPSMKKDFGGSGSDNSKKGKGK